MTKQQSQYFAAGNTDIQDVKDAWAISSGKTKTLIAATAASSATSLTAFVSMLAPFNAAVENAYEKMYPGLAESAMSIGNILPVLGTSLVEVGTNATVTALAATVAYVAGSATKKSWEADIDLALDNDQIAPI